MVVQQVLLLKNSQQNFRVRSCCDFSCSYIFEEGLCTLYFATNDSLDGWFYSSRSLLSLCSNGIPIHCLVRMFHNVGDSCGYRCGPRPMRRPETSFQSLKMFMVIIASNNASFKKRELQMMCIVNTIDLSFAFVGLIEIHVNHAHTWSPPWRFNPV